MTCTLRSALLSRLQERELVPDWRLTAILGAACFIELTRLEDDHPILLGRDLIPVPYIRHVPDHLYPHQQLVHPSEKVHDRRVTQYGRSDPQAPAVVFYGD
jgi:hypothetical protein